MFQVHIAVDYVGHAAALAPGWGVDSRRIKEYRRRANHAGVQYWRVNYLPLHFVPGNATKYRYQKRKRPYQAIKEELAQSGTSYVKGRVLHERVQRGGKVDIVRSGHSERSARSANVIASYPTRATLRIQVKPGVGVRPKDDKPDMRHEVTFTPANEREMMRVVVSNEFRSQLLADHSHLKQRL